MSQGFHLAIHKFYNISHVAFKKCANPQTVSYIHVHKKRCDKPCGVPLYLIIKGCVCHSLWHSCFRFAMQIISSVRIMTGYATLTSCYIISTSKQTRRGTAVVGKFSHHWCHTFDSLHTFTTQYLIQYPGGKIRFQFNVNSV